MEEINKSLKEKQEKAINQVKEMVQNLKIEIEAIKKNTNRVKSGNGKSG